MKNLRDIEPYSSRGAGYITGAFIGLIAAVIVFVITGNIAISIPLFAGISIPLGMVIGQRPAIESGNTEAPSIKLLIAITLIGIMLFLSISFI
jgi:hypothetical protein